MRQNHARIGIVLDRSGSMNSVREATVEGFNEFIRSQKMAPGSADVLLALFDHEYTVAYDKPLADVADMRAEDFVPRGYTALLDAIGRTVNDIGQRLGAMNEDQRPDKVIVVIMTDGHENSSQEFTRERIAQMVKLQRETYAWEFVFLGANQDAVMVGAGMNIPAASAMSYAASSKGVMASFSAAGNYAVQTRGGLRSAFTEADRKLAKG